MPRDNSLTSDADGYVCTDCGKDVSENDNVCPHCGADLTVEVEPQEEHAQGNNSTQTERIGIDQVHFTRHYKTTYTLAKIVEIVSWVVLIGGAISGIAIAADSKSPEPGILVIILSVVLGLLLVFMSQLTLILIDTENNTRRTSSENAKTNAMLADTLGTIASNLDKIARREEQKR